MLLKGKRVFIVEDNVRNRAIMQMLLEQQGARTAIERWGLDVIERLQVFAPLDIILLDLMLPDARTGYDVFKQIRAVGDFASVPIVAVSATDPASAIPACQAQGFAGFIAKPIKFEAFARQIALILDGYEVWNNTDVEEIERKGNQ